MNLVDELYEITAALTAAAQDIADIEKLEVSDET